MRPRSLFVVFTFIVLCSCGDNSGGQGMPVSDNAAATSKDFQLCPPLELHRDELASIVGFEQDAERALSMSPTSRKCFIRGSGGDFIGVESLPALVKSIEAYAESFDGSSSAVPNLGSDAVFIDDVSQPHVAFRMGSRIINVSAEYIEKPDQDTMVTLATRVHEILEIVN